MNRVIAVTPAGRRGYLELLGHYVLADPTIHEWHLWDNCRLDIDRVYINELATVHEKVKVVTIPAVGGANSSINRFYSFCNEPSTFYIKMDDDLVYLPPNFGRSLLDQAQESRGGTLWWSPMVINNASCSWLLKYFSSINIEADLTAQAACRIGWRSPAFAEHLHMAFLRALQDDRIASFYVPDQDVSLSRFSINCIGFFGSDVVAAGEQFCPIGVDDEEWLSAVLPAKLNRHGRIIGNLVVAHFSFWTQEFDLLKSNILEEYYRIAGLSLTHRPVRKVGRKDRVRFMLINRWLGARIAYTITP